MGGIPVSSYLSFRWKTDDEQVREAVDIPESFLELSRNFEDSFRLMLRSWTLGNLSGRAIWRSNVTDWLKRKHVAMAILTAQPSGPDQSKPMCLLERPMRSHLKPKASALSAVALP